MGNLKTESPAEKFIPTILTLRMKFHFLEAKKLMSETS